MAMAPELDNGATEYESILVSLKPSNKSSDGDFINREIRLTTDKPMFKIGRASKTVSKGLLPASDNAFFDSPVVSRTHAEITGNFNDGSVTVTDLGSLHGTFVNGKPTKETALALKQDDVVSFGIHVSRGLDVFYPASCKVTYVSTLNKPAERARSYCAPDSDCASDCSVSDFECDSASICSHTGPKAIPPDSAKSKTAIYEIEDSETSSNDDAISVEEITLCSETKVLPPLDKFVSEGRGETDDVYADDDEVVEEDYGEVNEDYKVDDVTNSSEEEEAEEEEEEEKDGDVEDDEYEGEEHEEEDDNKDVKLPEDMEGSYLSKQLEGYAKDTKKDSPPSLVFGKEPTPNNNYSMPVIGLWTPPPMSAEDVATLSRIVEDELIHEQEPIEEDVTNDENADVDPVDDGKPLLLEDTLPRSVSAKFDISSILNPSPPTSSPAKVPTDGIPATQAPGVLPAVYRNMPASYETAESNEAFCAGIIDEARMKVNVVIDSLQQTSPSPALHPTGSDLPPLVAPSGEEDSEDVGLTNATTFSSYKKRKANSKKRKADEMLACTSGISAATISVATPSAIEAPSAKRLATPAAVADKKKSKGRAWAVAEKIGIAALGGAVVLGSLIYTAPSF
ncbi:uncharacterized protein SPSK_08764 [Sporothrix schenckii 1099-18]|uniref:FHA domain-containing protein n=1 Tax=Sporothrix schenckii 1099-18 TaxID=1397361 RepID=A0A0F2M4N1_SPOSC|nr:uncharacterized protein SPSK_08764 [Sporothrix schenckii 1099-18]KJR84577.1 hypothetical protein SPSK_08764 [Sporothrix schenckii 1099-18]